MNQDKLENADYTHIVFSKTALSIVVGLNHHFGRFCFTDGYQTRLHCRQALLVQGEAISGQAEQRILNKFCGLVDTFKHHQMTASVKR